MGNNVVKSIVLVMVLVVLSFLVGAQVSDGLKDSMGAFAVIAAVVIGFSLLLLGKKSWYLAFLLPFVLSNAPIPYLDSTLAAYVVCIGLLIYHIIQCWVMGYARLKWHPLPALDILMLVVVLYMCVSYYRFPVAIHALGLEMEYVGGTPYVYAIGASIYYLYLSILDVRRTDVDKVIRWAFYAQVAMMLVNVALRLKSGNIYWERGENEDVSFSDTAGERRIVVFSAIGFCLLIFAYASRPLLTFLRSPRYLGLFLLAFFGISLTGARNQLVQSALSCIGISILRREMTVVTLMGIVTWVLLLGLGSGGAFERFPHTAQRFIAIVPGVHVSRATERETNASADVRIIAWKQAFDPKNGYIRDYIWGDGFQQSVRELGRYVTAQRRGTAVGIGLKNDTLARSGNWHNGFIYTMHRLGLVGCFLFYSVMLLGMAIFFKVGSYYARQPAFPYFCVYGLSCFVFPFVYSYNSRTPVHYFSHIISLAFIKLLYCLLRESGEISPLFHMRQQYVPLLIREDVAQTKLS